MSGAILAAIMLTVGVNYGWKQLPDGKFEYIIQIEPQLLDAMKDGEDIFSDLPPSFRGVRSFRIVVGTGMPPREGNPQAAEAPAANSVTPPAASPKPLTPDPKSRPVQVDRADYLQVTASETGPQAPQAKEQEPRKPWPALALSLGGLLASVSGNLYLGWITWETRSRYRRLLRKSSGSDDLIDGRFRRAEEEPFPGQFEMSDAGDPLDDFQS